MTIDEKKTKTDKFLIYSYFVFPASLKNKFWLFGFYDA